MSTSQDYNELKARTDALVGVDIDELIERVRLLSVKYGKAKAMVERMEHLRKSKLYAIVEVRRAEFQHRGEKATESHLEAIARSSGDYRGFIDTQYHEKVKMVEAEATYFAARNQLEATFQRLRFARQEMYLTNQN